jgi:UDP-N-acetylmuramate--alanine ligase
LASFNKRIIYYGQSSENDYRLQKNGVGTAEGEFCYQIFKKQNELGEVYLNVPGHHNALNALAAIAVASELGLPFDQIRKGIGRFRGVDRRLQFKGEAQGISIIDDYGHHPTEVKATLQALRERYPKKRIVVAFQPHRYTRTQICWSDFLPAFSDANEVLLWDIYSAGEPSIDTINSQRLAAEVQHPNTRYVGSGGAALETLVQHLKSGDVLLTLGAGDISKVGPAVLERLKT